MNQIVQPFYAFLFETRVKTGNLLHQTAHAEYVMKVCKCRKVLGNWSMSDRKELILFPENTLFFPSFSLPETASSLSYQEKLIGDHLSLLYFTTLWQRNCEPTP